MYNIYTLKKKKGLKSWMSVFILQNQQKKRYTEKPGKRYNKHENGNQRNKKSRENH